MSRSKKRKADVVSLIGFMALLRIARCWNQTGDKWINEPDVKEWLNEPSNKLFLALISIIGAIGIFHWTKNNVRLNRLQLGAAAAGLCAILAYRGAFGLFSIYYPQSTYVNIVRWPKGFMFLCILHLTFFFVEELWSPQ